MLFRPTKIILIHFVIIRKSQIGRKPFNMFFRSFIDFYMSINVQLRCGKIYDLGGIIFVFMSSVDI